MTTIKTDTKYNFTKAENDIFSWTCWDGTSGNTLTHKASGRDIYHMNWLNDQGKMEEPVTGETKDQAIKFWAELEELQNQKPQSVEITEETHGAGWCEKCHSYCYGDCQA
jgi:hypothetical protein